MTATLRVSLALAFTGLLLLPSWGRAQTSVTQQIGGFRFTTVSPAYRLPAANRW
jgi:hypothetical protein